MIFFYLLDNLQKGMCKNLNVLDNMKNELKKKIIQKNQKEGHKNKNNKAINKMTRAMHITLT